MRLGWALAWILAAGGCQRAAAPPSRLPSGESALARLKATYACATGVAGEAKVDHFSDRGRVRGRVLLYASRPSWLRFDVVSPPPFNAIVSTLVTGAGRFSLLDVRNRKFFEGPASACNLARLTDVPLEAHALVSLLGGQAPLLAHERGSAGIEWSRDGYYVVRVPSTRGASEELHLEPTPADFQKPWESQRLRVLEVRVVQQGIDLYRARLDGHRWSTTAPPAVDPDGLEPALPPSGPPCVVEVPQKIHIEVPETGEDVLFRYDDVKLNPPLPPGVFVQPVPDGVERVFVECAG